MSKLQRIKVKSTFASKIDPDQKGKETWVYESPHRVKDALSFLSFKSTWHETKATLTWSRVHKPLQNLPSMSFTKAGLVQIRCNISKGKEQSQ